LFDNGPEIIDLHSRYLQYKTVPTNKTAEPELNMMVTVQIGKVIAGNTTYIREYAITEKHNKELILNYIGNYKKLIYDGEVEPTLIVNKIDNKWVVTNNDNYHILKFGGFGESYSDNIPF
jgi:hypothetical protein